MTSTITDATALAWFDQFNVIADDRLCPEMTLIFADWLEDVHGLDSWAECLRWMVAEGKFPRSYKPNKVRSYKPNKVMWFFNDAKEKFYKKLDDELLIRHDIPNPLVDEIGRDVGDNRKSTIDFSTPQTAILAVMKVWHQREGEW